MRGSLPTAGSAYADKTIDFCLPMTWSAPTATSGGVHRLCPDRHGRPSGLSGRESTVIGWSSL